MDFSVRAVLDEAMDEPGLDEAVYRRCLADLAMVNRVTFTHRPTLRWLDKVTKSWPRGAPLTVLDVAYGQGDLLRAIAAWAARRGFVAELSGIDMNPRAAAAARAAGGRNIDYRTGDVFEAVLPQRPDFIVTSQFTHHLADADILRLMAWMEAQAQRGWHIADLHRHKAAYLLYPLLARLMRWHPIVRLDGQVSIARSFTRGDWERLLAAAKLAAEIHWHWLFRYAVSRLK
ncbi:MAG TPA: methyltransferase domain-containing protein [Acidocella sp.]|jgi:2-polyprenyl-3-methyl-5-hydroxy-6-metoxy-1,4-benzoquinol methylase|uniref:methyltransferase domain-containing protein n=1 Tax=Acidocella sp. TaxID=50710 RepID=UPI002C0A85E9|nr:methyltransferase domain-containing protein [Acidocella sp.]HVE23241.1 methyltransferase domain-containing protein [Acidocella sp.]